MTEQTAEGALEGASPEAVSTQDVASEATENTAGLTETGEPAEAETVEESAEETERKSRNQRRKEALERARTEAQEAAARAHEAEQRLKAVQDAAKQLPKPKLDAFGGNYEEYQAALNVWSLSQMFDQRTAANIKAEAQAEAARIQALRAQEQAVIDDHVNASAEDARKRYPDWDQVARAASMQMPLVHAVSRTDAPADVAYWLGQHPDVAQGLNALAANPDPQARFELGRRLSRIEAQLAAPPKPPVTSAPAPITPVKGKATPPVNPETMSFAEWKARRAAGWTPGT